jgi:hypothetical protein
MPPADPPPTVDATGRRGGVVRSSFVGGVVVLSALALAFVAVALTLKA